VGRESQKRRRKRRRAQEHGVEREAPRDAAGGTAEGGAGVPAAERARGAAASKDEIARERLEPLGDGERPTAVTVAAIVAGLIAVSNVIALMAGLEIEGRSFSAAEVLPPAVLMMVASVGMWHSRYWAVLGFQTILLFLIVIMSLSLLTAENVLAVLVALAVLGGAGTLFWFLIKAMARIQMPGRRPPASG
jgi:hypothetical protein